MFKPITAISDQLFYWIFTEPNGVEIKVSRNKPFVEVDVSN